MQNVKVTPSTVLGYSDQALSGISGDDTPLAMVSRRYDVGEQRARSLLAGAGVGIEMQERKIGVLSGGQKARLMMLALRLANPNFYLLDEPTNHLDIDGQEALEAELLAHQASCVLASHDRSFISADRQPLLADRQAAADRSRETPRISSARWPKRTAEGDGSNVDARPAMERHMPGNYSLTDVS